MKKSILIFVLLFAGGALGLARPFDRGLGDPGITYLPKGQFSFSLGGNYIGWTADAGDDLTRGVNFAGIITDANGGINLFNVNAGASWVFKDNWSLGVKLDYGNTVLDANNLSILGLVNYSDKHVRRETYSGILAGKRYIPLFNSRIIAFFGEVDLGASMGYNKSYEETDRGKEGTFSTLYKVSVSVLGGLSVFFMDNASFEVSLPVFSAGYQWNKMLELQEYESNLNGFYLSRKMNVLGVQMGVVYYF